MAEGSYRFADPYLDAMREVLARIEGGGDFLGPKFWKYDGPPMSKREFDRRPDKQSPALFSGYTLGRFQGDAAAGNPHARDAFYDIIGQALNKGEMRQERYQEIMGGIGRMASKQNPTDRHRDFIGGLLQAPEGRARVAQMDEAILQDDQNMVGRLEQAFEKRWGRALDPISLAMLTAWANKFSNLNQTQQALTGESAGLAAGGARQAPRVGDVLDYLAGQKFFRGGEDKKSREKAKERWKHHLEGLAGGTSEAVKSGRLPARNLLSADVSELNRRLRSSGSQVRLTIEGARSVGRHNDRDADGIPDDLQVDHAAYMSPLIRRRAEAAAPPLRKLAALSDSEFADATRGARWADLWRQAEL